MALIISLVVGDNGCECATGWGMASRKIEQYNNQLNTKKQQSTRTGALWRKWRCPHECVTSYVSGDYDDFVDSIKTCRKDDESHMWKVRSDGSYVRIESRYHHDMCIAVDYKQGEGESMLAQTCYNGELVLQACDAEYGTEWYFTGGQLVNSLCWGAGCARS